MWKQFYYSAWAVTAAIAMALVLGNDGRVSDVSAEVKTSPAPAKTADPAIPVARNGQVVPPERTSERQACRASELLGLNLRGNVGNDNIGEIKDLMIQPDGRVSYAAVSFGGFLGIGDKMFAVPCEAIHVVKEGDKISYARIDVTEETLKNRQGFDKDHWPEKADRSFLTAGVQRQTERSAVGSTNR